MLIDKRGLHGGEVVFASISTVNTAPPLRISIGLNIIPTQRNHIQRRSQFAEYTVQCLYLLMVHIGCYKCSRAYSVLLRRLVSTVHVVQMLNKIDNQETPIHVTFTWIDNIHLSHLSRSVQLTQRPLLWVSFRTCSTEAAYLKPVAYSRQYKPTTRSSKRCMIVGWTLCPVAVKRTVSWRRPVIYWPHSHTVEHLTTPINSMDDGS